MELLTTSLSPPFRPCSSRRRPGRTSRITKPLAGQGTCKEPDQVVCSSERPRRPLSSDDGVEPVLHDELEMLCSHRVKLDSPKAHNSPRLSTAFSPGHRGFWSIRMPHPCKTSVWHAGRPGLLNQNKRESEREPSPTPESLAAGRGPETRSPSELA